MKSAGISFFLFFLYSICFAQSATEIEIVNAIRSENLDFLKNLDSVEVNKPLSENRGNALIFAIQNGSPKSVEALLQRKADPNFVFHSRSPLMYAARNPDISVIRLLLKYGAVINAMDSVGNTALMIASTGSKLNVVKLLIRNGASLNHRNKKGYNARDFAIRSNNKAIAVYLKHVFEKKLPNYFDGPYVNFINRKKVKVAYFKHDSLRKRTEAFYQYHYLRDLNNEFNGFGWDVKKYPIERNFVKPPTEINNVKKLLVIGDVHGQYDTLRIFLQNNKVIDENLHWTFGDGTVIFIGDILDRGEKVTEALWLIYRMEKEAVKSGGMVHLLLGNHELLVLNEDERFVSEKYFYLFRNLKVNYSRFFNNQTFFGRWLRSKNSFLKVDSLLFVHGGIHPHLLHYNVSLDSANTLISNYLKEKKKTSFAHNQTLHFLLGSNGPFWYRGMVDQGGECEITEEQLNNILTAYNVSNIIVGHTFKPEIKKYYGGRIISIDIPFYLHDGYPMQALLLVDDKFVILNSKGESKDLEL
jgi:hypothetical protein